MPPGRPQIRFIPGYALCVFERHRHLVVGPAWDGILPVEAYSEGLASGQFCGEAVVPQQSKLIVKDCLGRDIDLDEFSLLQIGAVERILEPVQYQQLDRGHQEGCGQQRQPFRRHRSSWFRQALCVGRPEDQQAQRDQRDGRDDVCRSGP